MAVTPLDLFLILRGDAFSALLCRMVAAPSFPQVAVARLSKSPPSPSLLRVGITEGY